MDSVLTNNGICHSALKGFNRDVHPFCCGPVMNAAASLYPNLDYLFNAVQILGFSQIQRGIVTVKRFFCKPRGYYYICVCWYYLEHMYLDIGIYMHIYILETLESPLDCKEIKPVNPKGNNQSWIFIGRTDAEAEATILWPPDSKNRLIGKDPDAGQDWRQEEKGTTEDEMVGWHHRLNGHEFE